MRHDDVALLNKLKGMSISGLELRPLQVQGVRPVPRASGAAHAATASTDAFAAAGALARNPTIGMRLGLGRRQRLRDVLRLVHQ